MILAPNKVIGKRVQVYRNLHKQAFSVKDKKSGRVILYADCIELKDCKCVVREGSRQRVLKEKRKNVHAWIEGTAVSFSCSTEWLLRELYYNPYKCKSFIYEDTRKPILELDQVVLFNNKAFAIQ